MNDSAISIWLRKGPRIERTAAADEEILTPVELVGDRTVADFADAGVPQRRAITGAQRNRVARGVAREGQPRFRRQHARARRAVAKVVAPANFSGLIVNRAQRRSAIQ